MTSSFHKKIKNMETNEIKALINSKLTLPMWQRQFVSSINQTKIPIVWQGNKHHQSTIKSSWLDYSSHSIKKWHLWLRNDIIFFIIILNFLFLSFPEIIRRNTINFSEGTEKGWIGTIMTDHGNFFAA